MTEWWNEKKYLNILRDLLREGELDFKRIAVIVGNRNKARKLLDDLIKHGAIKDLAFPRKIGQVARYVLTDKGQEIALHNLLFQSNQSLRELDTLLSRLTEPKQVDKLRKFMDEPTITSSEWEALGKGTLSQEEFLERFERRTSEKQGLLTKLLRDWHRLYLEVMLPKKLQGHSYAIGFTREGYVLLKDMDTKKKKEGVKP